MIFFLYIKVMLVPRAIMKHRNAIHNPWFPNLGIKMYHDGMKTKIVDIIIVFLMAFDAVAPM